jgi:hypothetical protein
MIIAAQSHAFPLRCFTRMPGAGRECSIQSRSPLLLLFSLCERVMASTRCMQLATLAAVALLAAEAWGVSNAIATRARACLSQGSSCELSSCVEVRAPHSSQANILGNAPARNLVSMVGSSAIDGSSPCREMKQGRIDGRIVLQF